MVRWEKALDDLVRWEKVRREKALDDLVRWEEVRREKALDDLVRLEEVRREKALDDLVRWEKALGHLVHWRMILDGCQYTAVFFLVDNVVLKMSDKKLYIHNEYGEI